MWKHVRYVRPSRRRTPDTRKLMELMVAHHKRQAANRLRHCPGCGGCLPTASTGKRCLSCARRAEWGDTRHWWTGRGAERRHRGNPSDEGSVPIAYVLVSLLRILTCVAPAQTPQVITISSPSSNTVGIDAIPYGQSQKARNLDLRPCLR